MHNCVLILCQLDSAVWQRLKIDPRIVAAENIDDHLVQELGTTIIAVVVRSGIRIDEEFINLFPRLQFVIRAGSGVDNINLGLLQAKRIRLFRNPGLSASAVAELALASLILLARRIPEAASLLESKVWSKSTLMGESIADFTVAIWGAGQVGQACMDLLAPLCQRVVFVSWPSNPSGCKQMTIEDVKREADVHILCLPLRPSTRNIFDKKFIHQLRSRSPYIINVARFECADFKELVCALEERYLRGAFIDPIDRSDLDYVHRVVAGKEGLNLMLSQHLGAQRIDVLREMGEWVMQQIEEALSWAETMN